MLYMFVHALRDLYIISTKTAGNLPQRTEQLSRNQRNPLATFRATISFLSPDGIVYAQKNTGHTLLQSHILRTQRHKKKSSPSPLVSSKTDGLINTGTVQIQRRSLSSRLGVRQWTTTRRQVEKGAFCRSDHRGL